MQQPPTGLVHGAYVIKVGRRCLIRLQQRTEQEDAVRNRRDGTTATSASTKAAATNHDIHLQEELGSIRVHLLYPMTSFVTHYSNLSVGAGRP